MCNCSRPISQTDCQRLIECIRDPKKRFFIYNISSEKGINKLQIACVKQGKTANVVAIERGFIDKDGNPEWYHVTEHPCLYKN